MTHTLSTPKIIRTTLIGKAKMYELNETSKNIITKTCLIVILMCMVVIIALLIVQSLPTPTTQPNVTTWGNVATFTAYGDTTNLYRYMTVKECTVDYVLVSDNVLRFDTSVATSCTITIDFLHTTSTKTVWLITESAPIPVVHENS